MGKRKGGRGGEGGRDGGGGHEDQYGEAMKSQVRECSQHSTARQSALQAAKH